MIQIVPYDPSWPLTFLKEARNIRTKFGHLALRVDHVGSTSVPNLAAKPVIDIQVSVVSLEPRAPLQESMRDLGYTHFDLGAFDLVYPFFKKPASWPSTHHVHLCSAGSEQERTHLAFRDYLRAHPDVAAEYSALKHQLAVAFDGTTLASEEGYSLAKTEFVSSVLERAFSEGFPLSADSDA